MITVEHLTKHYGRVAAVDDISFEVPKGEILGFLGPNGAGKTTTMRILTGYKRPRHSCGSRRIQTVARSPAPRRVSTRDRSALSRDVPARLSRLHGKDPG